MTTVFIVDDDEAVRDSLGYLLELVGMKVETYESAEGFLESYTIYCKGCLLLDIRMPGMSGLQLQQELNKNRYPIPIIMVTGHGDVPMAVRAMKSGAMEFVEKPFNDQDLLDLIHVALAQDKVNHRKRLEYDSIVARMKNLTRREEEVLSLVIAKHSNKNIADKLKVSVKTVESHRKNLMQKMHAESLVHLLEMLGSHAITLEDK